MKTSVFKSEAARDRFRAVYHQILSRFPFGQRFVQTSLGQTFVLQAGQETNPPVVLLHGSCSNSAFWFPEMMALSGQHAVYAPDIPGEAGNSGEYRPALETDAFADWLRETLDALGIKTAALIGNSLGGWMALKFAASDPDRVSKLVLIASAGIAEIRPQFMGRAVRPRQAGEAAPIDPDVMEGQGIPREVLDFMKLIVDSYDPVQNLPVFSEGQLMRLNMPVLFIGGEEDPIIDAPQSAGRLSRLVPQAQIRLLKNCGHMITNAVDFFLPFLSGSDQQ